MVLTYPSLMATSAEFLPVILVKLQENFSDFILNAMS